MGSENIVHFNAIRLRLQGSGNLNPVFINLDDSPTASLVPIVMNPSPGREPLRLANFVGQRVRLKVGTNQMDEIFKINRIIIFTKDLWTDFPA